MEAKKETAILIVDDEKDIVEIISYNLEKNGFQTFKAYNGIDAIRISKLQNIDLIILDVNMPYKNGFDTCKELRTIEKIKNIPILFLTALATEDAEIKGFELGADDYIVKPINQNLLLTRIKACLRRNQITSAKDEIKIGELLINKTNHSVSLNDKEIVFAKKEFELLYLLASQPQKVFLRTEILEKIWGNDVLVVDRTIDVHIRKIRKKLNVDLISTIKGVGYKFKEL